MSWQSYIKTKEDLLRMLSSIKVTEKFPIPDIFNMGTKKVRLREIIQRFEDKESVSRKDLEFLRKVWYALESVVEDFVDQIKMGSIDRNDAIKEMEYYGGLKKAHRKVGEILWVGERELRGQKRKKELYAKKRKWRIRQKRKTKE